MNNLFEFITTIVLLAQLPMNYANLASSFRQTSISSSNSVINSDGVNISINNGVILCDDLVCPDKTQKCVVTKSSIGETDVNHVRKCLDANGNILEDKDTTENNPRPGTVVNSHQEATISGTGSSASLINVTSNSKSSNSKSSSNSVYSTSMGLASFAIFLSIAKYYF